jgi:hypothetical protein
MESKAGSQAKLGKWQVEAGRNKEHEHSRQAGRQKK